ncbi:MAG: hypothetical protein NZL92_02660 [Gloeomargarita sp. SKYG116]|nr:hypothetical protein [Gloeomargarita sp. SKYG116]MCS7226275.1 hypothetical protein [Gloeomargarita sp. SKYB31]MDW8400580.1 hypothetical protein [Gloeomargarita sp. SKYGB_i_bin116]
MLWRGAWAALADACLTAFLSHIYATWGKLFGPWLLNWLEGWMALGMLGLTLWLRREPWPAVAPDT